MRQARVALLLVLGCGTSARLKPVDTIAPPDAEAPVSRPPDAGDGLVELASADAGRPELDAGTPDAGAPDAGQPPVTLPPTELGTVTAGAMFSCALAQGDVYCWGKNDFGQLGTPAGGSSAVPAKVPGVTNAIEVSAGQDHACALGSNGRVWCWGANSLGQLGRGTWTTSEAPDFVPGLISIRSVSVGAQGHACALTANGLVTCWGRGLGNTGAPSALPVAVQGLAGVHAVSTGDHHVCALLDSQAVLCWGGNYAGALGDGTKIERQTPAPVSGLPVATRIAAGNGYTCAIAGASEVWCWGRGESGQSGVSTQPEVLVPRQLPGVTADGVIVSKGLHTCIRSSTGALSCFGSNAVGQLGTGQQSANPEVAPLPTGITDAVGGGAGAFHTCVRRATGAVACWGINSDGQLGDGHSGTLSMQAVAVVGLP